MMMMIVNVCAGMIGYHSQYSENMQARQDEDQKKDKLALHCRNSKMHKMF